MSLKQRLFGTAIAGVLSTALVGAALAQGAPDFSGVTVNVGTIEGGLRPNVVAPESTAVVDVRVQTQKDVSSP